MAQAECTPRCPVGPGLDRRGSQPSLGLLPGALERRQRANNATAGGTQPPRPRPRDASWASWTGRVFPTQACGRMGARAGQAQEPRGRQGSRSSHPTLLHPSGSQLPSGSAGVVPGRDTGMKRGRGHAVIAAALPESRLSLARGCGAGGFIKRASSSALHATVLPAAGHEDLSPGPGAAAPVLGACSR